MAARRWNQHEIEAVGNLAETAAELAQRIEDLGVAVGGCIAALLEGRGGRRAPRAQAWIQCEKERISDLGFQVYSDAARLRDDARAVRLLALESAGGTKRKDEAWLRRQLEGLDGGAQGRPPAGPEQEGA